MRRQAELLKCDGQHLQLDNRYQQGNEEEQQQHHQAHLEAQRIFAEQLPVAPLYLQIKLAVTRPDMCGFIMDPTNPSEFWNIEEFDYGEGCEE